MTNGYRNPTTGSELVLVVAAAATGAVVAQLLPKLTVDEGAETGLDLTTLGLAALAGAIVGRFFGAGKRGGTSTSLVLAAGAGAVGGVLAGQQSQTTPLPNGPEAPEE